MYSRQISAPQKQKNPASFHPPPQAFKVISVTFYFILSGFPVDLMLSNSWHRSSEFPLVLSFQQPAAPEATSKWTNGKGNQM